jgi:hypothetical protein
MRYTSHCSYTACSNNLATLRSTSNPTASLLARPFQDIALLRNAFQLSLQALHLRLLVVHLRPLGWRCAVALDPLLQAVRTHAQTRGDFRGPVAAFRHLLDRFKLELLRIPLAAHTFSLKRTIIGSGVSIELVGVQMHSCEHAVPFQACASQRSRPTRHPCFRRAFTVEVAGHLRKTSLAAWPRYKAQSHERVTAFATSWQCEIRTATLQARKLTITPQKHLWS